MDVLITFLAIVALFGAVASAAGTESRDSFTSHDH